MSPRLWGAALVVALLGAWASTESVMGVPPSPLGLAGLAATILAIGAGASLGDRLPGTARLALTGLLLLALSLAASQDFLRPGIAWGHDITHHAWALWSLWRCVLDGDWFPRWNPYLSLGVPLLQFYAPLPYVAAWPAQALGASPAQALAFLTVLGQLGTAAALYGCVRWRGGSHAGGLLAATAGALAPYHLMDQTFRVALGETMAFPWIAPALVATWSLARGEEDRRASWVLGISVVALLLTHLLSLIMVASIGALVALLGLRAGGRAQARGSVAALVLVGALAAGVSAAWWLPVVTEMEHTSVSQISKPGQAISPFAALPDEPVRRRLWPRYDVRRAIGEGSHPGKGMPMYFGWGLLALLGLALATPRDRDRGDARAVAVLALITLALALYPMARVLDGLPALGRIMFPWRLYAPATVLAALAGGLAWTGWMAHAPARARALLLTGTLAVLAWDAAPYLGAAERVPDHEGLGLVEFSGDRIVPIQGVPRDRWVRVEDLRLPPSDYDWELALSRRAFPDYMSPTLRRRYGLHSKPPTEEESAFYGASYRIRRGQAHPTALDAEPMVSFRPDGGAWRGLPEASFDLAPERVAIALPTGLPAGRVRFTMGWFPGWEARVEPGGAWVPAERASWLLATSMPDGATTVAFRYSALRPWGRAAGLGISGVSLLGLVGWSWRRRE